MPGILGPSGFDKDYFVQQVAGLAQLAGEFMLVHPRVIDLGWGTLKSALLNLHDSTFALRQEATARRHTLVNQYVVAFRHVETGALNEARRTLNDLAANIAAWVVTDQQGALKALIDGQLAKLA